MKKFLLSLLVVLGLMSGCAMPTKPSEIPGVYVSSVKYKDYSCDDLTMEFFSLSKR